MRHKLLIEKGRENNNNKEKTYLDEKPKPTNDRIYGRFAVKAKVAKNDTKRKSKMNKINNNNNSCIELSHICGSNMKVTQHWLLLCKALKMLHRTFESTHSLKQN